ncbi:hypothetical protein F2P79_012707 [Pimephales promelas]|nr:hypothetical protein F2P79_012707 [Pimephales promelas]
MDPQQHTDLESAINTLVENFHSASSTNANTLTAQEFQSMLSKELPTMAKTAGDQEGLNKLATGYLSIVPDHVHPFMAIMYAS